MPRSTRSIASTGDLPDRRALGLLLARACEQADAEAARRWLLEGADPKTRSARAGATPLHLACGAADVERAGARRKLSFTHGPSSTGGPFERAAIAAMLLDAGADLLAEDGQGRIALHVACAAGSGPLARLLIERGSPVEAHSRASHGSTPLCQACAPKDSYAPGGPVDALLELGASPHAPGSDRIPPLHRAVANPGALAALLRAGADPDSRDGAGRTALLRAYDTNRAASARLLTLAGADPTLADERGRAPGCDDGRGGAAAWLILAEIERLSIERALGPAGADPARAPRL